MRHKHSSVTRFAFGLPLFVSILHLLPYSLTVCLSVVCLSACLSTCLHFCTFALLPLMMMTIIAVDGLVATNTNIHTHNKSLLIWPPDWSKGDTTTSLALVGLHHGDGLGGVMENIQSVHANWQTSQHTRLCCHLIAAQFSQNPIIVLRPDIRAQSQTTSA